MTPESFVHAVQDLDPGTRALLDLSVHRGLDDAEIAELLGADPGYVSSSREAAIAQLASDLGMHGDPERVRDALTEMPGEAWRPRVDGEAVGQRDSEAANGAAPEQIAEPSERPRSQRRLTLFVLLVVAAVAAAVIASGGSHSEQSTPSKPATPAPTRQPSKPAAPPAKPRGVPLESLSASSSAKGTAQLSGRKLTLTVSGLPRPAGTYEVWLFNDEIDAIPVKGFSAGTATVKATLPRPPAGYRYLDVSLEPADGNPNHSGQSVMRVPLRSLR